MFWVALGWSLPRSTTRIARVYRKGFCAYLVVSAGLCRFHCFVLVLWWSLLVSAGFAVLCWFCAGPTEDASTFFKTLCWNRKKIYTYMDYSLSRCLLGHILDVRALYPSVDEHQNVCIAEDANSKSLSGRCESSGGRSRAISRRRLGSPGTLIAPVAQRLPKGRVIDPEWDAVPFAQPGA